MHKQTYKRHYEILTYIENEFHKNLKHITRFSTREHIKKVLHSIGIIKGDLINAWNALSQLRKNEKELIKILNEFNVLNKTIDMKQILSNIRSNKMK